MKSWSVFSMPLKLTVSSKFFRNLSAAVGLLLISISGAFAQSNDSLQVKPAEQVIAEEEKTVVADTTKNRVRTATLLALIPGGGQIYNGKYWKLPLVYGALGATVYATIFNHDQYQIYLNAFNKRLDDNANNDEFVGVYSDRQLIELQNQYRKWRDLSIILTAAAYGLQVLDAYVDAHLQSFDVSDDLTLKWEPAVISTDYTLAPQAIGLGVTISLK